MATIPSDSSKGLVTARDPSTLKPGELSEARACEYRVGSPHLYKQRGRSSRNADLGSPIQGLVRMQYDTATNKIIAVAGGSVYESAESTSPIFGAAVLTGLDDEVAPQFTGYNERWLMQNGVDSNYIREPNGVTDQGGIAGNWRTNGMQPPTTAPAYVVISSGTTTVRPSTSTGTYSNLTRAYDTDLETYATGNFNVTATWTWTSNFAADPCTLYVDHACSAGAPQGPTNPKFDTVDTGDSDATLLIEYTTDGGTVWHPITTSTNFSRTTAGFALTTGTSIANMLKVRTTTTGSIGSLSHKVYDLRVSAGALASYTAENNIFYGITEIYIDSDGIEFESVLSDTAMVLVADLAAKYGVTLTIPTKVNSKTTKFGIYRSVDEAGGGYPFMYRLATIASTATTWVDDFSILPSDLPTDKPLLSFYEVTYPTGETIIAEVNGAPPKAKLALSFQGVMTYIPSTPGQGHFLFYSLASTISARGIEQVPSFQYLDFQSPKNDTLTSGAVTNGGKSYLAFFANYTMLVNYLPQASDGVFDNRVKEYVSNNRGSAGRLTCCEFTLPAGQTLVASVDALGLWVTNGVNQMDEWSRDLNWAADFSGVDLTTAELVDNTAKRRLELLYQHNGARLEHHFFYGRLKEDGDGKPGPIITGPHPMGIRCKHYTQVAGSWVGFSGDSTATGDVFLEETSYADDANGYDTDGNIPMSWTLADSYIPNLSSAHIIESITARFTNEVTKEFSLEAQFSRDAGFTATMTKIFTPTPAATIYAHRYSDRSRLRFLDISNTQAPAFVGCEQDVSGAGPSRDA